MRLGRRSTNISDRRGMGGMVAGGGVGVLVLTLIGLFLGVDPRALLEAGGGGGATQEPGQMGTPADPAGDTIASMLGSTEDAWRAIFAQNGAAYPEPTLVLFEGAVQSACGFAQAAVGPFYCPRDQQVYIDLAFFRELRDRFGADGDFARAYVIAHEVGHHVQNVTGVLDRTGAGARDKETSVRQELQADCLAGIWAYHAGMQDLLQPGDVEEALGAAAAIGDDRLQQQTQGRVVPESFTHGSSAQRMRWFRRGLETGSLDACDTFAASRL